MDIDLHAVNRELKEAGPEAIVRWALSLQRRCMTTTSFSPNSAVMLHLVRQLAPEMPVVWVDSGYNMADAYRVAEQLTLQLDLNLRVYTPLVTAERRNAVHGGIPHPDDSPELFERFVQEVKLEPFARALAELRPEVWLTGIRKEETRHRQSLDIVTWDARGLLKVAPLFHWNQAQVEAYMERFQLPTCRHYFDPTKLNEHSECGLHTAA